MFIIRNTDVKQAMQNNIVIGCCPLPELSDLDWARLDIYRKFTPSPAVASVIEWAICVRRTVEMINRV